MKPFTIIACTIGLTIIPIAESHIMRPLSPFLPTKESRKLKSDRDTPSGASHTEDITGENASDEESTTDATTIVQTIDGETLISAPPTPRPSSPVPSQQYPMSSSSSKPIEPPQSSTAVGDKIRRYKQVRSINNQLRKHNSDLREKINEIRASTELSADNEQIRAYIDQMRRNNEQISANNKKLPRTDSPATLEPPSLAIEPQPSFAQEHVRHGAEPRTKESSVLTARTHASQTAHSLPPSREQAKTKSVPKLQLSTIPSSMSRPLSQSERMANLSKGRSSASRYQRRRRRYRRLI